ncbi:PKD domain-containing protein [Pedobacter cryoconitis]|uniref:PKD domain-containing protein n=1 Tax=Pedobacter cryoconitis TaxID=188932 RepID=A0A327S272_9SPHI|nr:PKD domain-containing protein [Pedobacter cryoconitis]RAJ23129.1 hypothetical protein LY11_04567 [Pedobacter cryoconitis]
MKLTYSLLIFTLFSFYSCKKDPALPAPSIPKASFTVNGDTTSNLTLKAAIDYTLDDASKDGATFAWDLGAGTFSTKKNTLFSISKAGDYTLSLTVKSTKGQTAVTNKKIKVISPFLKTVTLTNINWTTDQNIPKSDKADVWMEITKREKGKEYPVLPGGSFDALLIYKSPVYKDALPNDNFITYTLSEKLGIDEAAVVDGRYDIRVLIKTTSGVYTLFSSNYGGNGALFNGKTTTKKFSWSLNVHEYSLEMFGYYE